MMCIALATEDEVSEAVGVKLLAEHSIWAGVSPMLLRKNGSGYLRDRMDSWRQMANRQIMLVLTDLDRVICPLALLEDWLGAERQCHQNLLLRVAVREIESWLLADHDALKKLIGNKGRFPMNPDELPDPKRHILGLAQKAPRAVREDLIAQQGVVASQGIGYNRRLVEWVQTEWSPEKAAARSPSLSRARYAIRMAADGFIKLQ